MTVINLPFYLGAHSNVSGRRRFGWVNLPVEVEEASLDDVQHSSTRLYVRPADPNKVDIHSEYLFRGRAFRASANVEVSASGTLFDGCGILSEVPLDKMTEKELHRSTDLFSRDYYDIRSGAFYRNMDTGHQHLSSIDGVAGDAIEAAHSWAKKNFLLVDGRLLIQTAQLSLVLTIAGNCYSASLSKSGNLGGIHFAYPDEDFNQLKLVSEQEMDGHYVRKAGVLRQFKDEVSATEFAWAADTAFNPQVLEQIASSYNFSARSVVSVALDTIEMHQYDWKKDPKAQRLCREVLKLEKGLNCDQSEEAVIDRIANAIPLLPMFRYSARQREMIDLVLERYHDRPVEDLKRGFSPCAGPKR
jgi:hypothetical protein